MKKYKKSLETYQLRDWRSTQENRQLASWVSKSSFKKLLSCGCSVCLFALPRSYCLRFTRLVPFLLSPEHKHRGHAHAAPAATHALRADLLAVQLRLQIAHIVSAQIASHLMRDRISLAEVEEAELCKRRLRDWDRSLRSAKTILSSSVDPHWEVLGAMFSHWLRLETVTWKSVDLLTIFITLYEIANF